MDLRINQQFGQIGLDIKQPSYDLEVQHPQLDLEIDAPQIQIEQKQPRVKIDQTQCFADIGRRYPLDFSRHLAALSHRLGFEGIAQIADEGDLLASIEQGIDIADIALMNSQHQDEFDVAAVPEHRPVIDVIVEDLQIAIKPGNVTVNPLSGQILGQLDWGQVGVNWRIKPSIDIEYIGRRLDVNA
jgi:hypothetical protein